MLNVNRATLVGHAGRDPEIRDLKNGGKAATFTLATTEKWTDAEGRPAEATEWHRIVVYGGAVEAVGKMLKQGRPGDGRRPDRHARIHRQGRQRPDRHGDRRLGMAGHGQHPVGPPREPGSRGACPGPRTGGQAGDTPDTGDTAPAPGSPSGAGCVE